MGQLQLREALTFWCILPQCLERELVECARRTRDSSTGTPCGGVKQRKHGCEPADIITDIRVCVPRAVSLASLIDTVVGCHPNILKNIRERLLFTPHTRLTSLRQIVPPRDFFFTCNRMCCRHELPSRLCLSAPCRRRAAHGRRGEHVRKRDSRTLDSGFELSGEPLGYLVLH